MRCLRLLVLVLAAGCDIWRLPAPTVDLPLSPDAMGWWNLRTVNGKPLPATDPAFGALYGGYGDSLSILSSLLTVLGDGSYIEFSSVRSFPPDRAIDSLTERGTWVDDFSQQHEVIFSGCPSCNDVGSISQDTLTRHRGTVTEVYTR
jgi:hypothetical protein